MKAETLRSALRLALILLLFYLLQSAVFARLRLDGIAPLPLPLLPLAVGLLGGGLWGGCFGLAAGIVCDASLGGAGLLFAVMLTVYGFFSGFLGEFILTRSFPTFFLCSLLALPLAAALQLLFLRLTIPAPLGILLLTGLKQSLLSLLFTVPVYACCRWALRPLRSGKRKLRF